MLEAALRMFYLQNILSPLFCLTTSLCFFSYSLMCAGTHTDSLLTLIRPHMQLVYCFSTLLGEKLDFFMPLLRVYHTKHALSDHISCVRCVLSSPFSAFFFLLNPPCRPISHMSVSGVFAVPEQSRLANGVEERGVEQGA